MRVAVVSDIHANLAALNAVLADAGVVDETWCLGDLVGYGPQPNECIDTLRKREPHLLCIAGNHDWAALGKLDTAQFNNDAESAALWTRRTLTKESHAYLDALPERLQRDEITLVHGSPRDPIMEYVVSLAVARANFAVLTTRYCLLGHSHLPFVMAEADQPGDMPEHRVAHVNTPVQLDARRLLINPGSVGQPRDGIHDASYLILDTTALTIEHRRVPYPIKETQNLMEQAGLPKRLIARLDYGL